MNPRFLAFTISNGAPISPIGSGPSSLYESARKHHRSAGPSRLGPKARHHSRYS